MFVEFFNIKYCDEIHSLNKEKGFWDNERSDEELISLIVGEVSEALEALRENKRAKMTNFIDESQNSLVSFLTAFKREIKDSFEDELADICIRICDYIGFLHSVYLTEERHNQFLKEAIKKKYEVDKIVNENFKFIHSLIKIIISSTRYNYAGLYIALRFIHEYCELNNIDYQWHIKNKLKFNQNRPKKHGKLF